MKKYFSCLFAALLAMMMIVSCGKDSKKAAEAPVAPVEEPSYVEDNSNDYSASDSSNSSKISYASWEDGVIFYSNVGLWETKEDDETRVKWIGALPKGLGVQVDVDGDKCKKYPLYINNDKKTTDMAKIMVDGKVCYASWSCVVPYAIPCVMVGTSKDGEYYEPAYSQQLKTKISKWKIPGGTVGALIRNKNLKAGWTEASFYVEPNSDYKDGLTITEMFYPEDSIRTDKSSVDVAILATRIKALKETDDGIWREAFDIANEICNDSTVLRVVGFQDER